MTYTAQSPLRGTGLASAAQIDAWFAKNGLDPSGLGTSITTQAQQAGLNSDLIAAQIAHETGYWTSDFAQNRDNPAGLGAINADPGQALTFATVAAGVHAMVAHLRTYVEGAANPWQADDPRYAATESSDMFGKARVPHDLDQHWAWSPQAEYDAEAPSLHYGDRIAALANELVTFAATPQKGTTMGRDPQASWKGTSNFDQGRAGYVVDHITCHMTAGTNSINWLMGTLDGGGNTDSSATYLVERDGTLYQFVDENDTPWADGNLLYNHSGISIEHEDLEGQPFTDAQIQASIALQARIARRQGWTHVHHPTDAVLPAGGPAGTANVIGHSQVPDPNNPSIGGGGSHHLGCPGPLFPWDQVIAGVNAILSGQAPQATPPANPALPTPDMQSWTDPATGFTVAGGFLGRFKQLQTALATISAGEVLLVVGHPTGNERRDPDGVTRQGFEHVVFEWHPGAAPSRFDVLETTTNPYHAH